MQLNECHMWKLHELGISSKMLCEVMLVEPKMHAESVPYVTQTSVQTHAFK